MYQKSAVYYDTIYRAVGKDYEAEARRVHELIQNHKRSAGHRLLDVACGTGGHVQHLKEQYLVEGLDKNPDMLELARIRNPGTTFHVADMTDFQLDSSFDAVVCLLSSIGYVRTTSTGRRRTTGR
jgi:ubiquinone/menaquinone biosynthesis C-methylase UbiE